MKEGGRGSEGEAAGCKAGLQKCESSGERVDSGGGGGGGGGRGGGGGGGGSLIDQLQVLLAKEKKSSLFQLLLLLLSPSSFRGGGNISSSRSSSSSSSREGEEGKHLLFNFLPPPFIDPFLKTSSKGGIVLALGKKGGMEGGRKGGRVLLGFLVEGLGSLGVSEAF